MQEPQRTDVREHAGACKLLGGRLGGGFVDPRERRGERALDIVAEHGDGLGERDRGRGEPRERGSHRVANRIGHRRRSPGRGSRR